MTPGKFYLSLCSSVSVKKVAGKFILAGFFVKNKFKSTIILVYLAGNAKSMENLQQTLIC